MNASLRLTLLFASALQALGAEHDVSNMLEHAVRTRDPEAARAADRAIETLGAADRESLLMRFEGLWGGLPEEARAAA